MEKYTAICKFCGQCVASPQEFEKEEDAVEYGSLHCTCGQSKRYAEVEAAKKRAARILNNFSNDVIVFVCGVIDGIGNDWLCKVTAKIDFHHTITISQTAKGKIKLSLEKKTSTSTEL